MKFYVNAIKKMFPVSDCSIGFNRVFADLYMDESRTFIDDRRLPESWRNLDKDRWGLYSLCIDQFMGYLEFTLDFCIKHELYTFDDFYNCVYAGKFEIKGKNVGEVFPVISVESPFYFEKFYKAIYEVLTPIFDIYAVTVYGTIYEEVGFEMPSGRKTISNLEAVKERDLRYYYPLYYGISTKYERDNARQVLGSYDVTNYLLGELVFD